jgi:hypothetical protein
MSAEPVRAWKVDQLDRLVITLQCANMPLDRNARIITDALAKACQTIE